MAGPPWVDAICLFKCRTSLPAKRTPELPVGLAEALILTTRQFNFFPSQSCFLPFFTGIDPKITPSKNSCMLLSKPGWAFR